MKDIRDAARDGDLTPYDAERATIKNHEAIEEMLAAHYHEATDEDATDDTAYPTPDDPKLNRRTGKVLDFELDTMAGIPHGDVLRIKVLLYTGDTNVFTLPWPDDPTDKTERLVRLFDYLGIPLDKLTELEGAYVPLKKFGTSRYRGPEDAKRLQIEIPPVKASGNYALYTAKRAVVTRSWLVEHGERAAWAIAALAWAPAVYGILSMSPPSSALAASVWFLLFMVSIASGMVLVGISGDVISKAWHRYFPKPE